MEQNKVMLIYDNYDILCINADNERCENKFEQSIKDNEKKICMLKNGNFLILNANRKIITQYSSTKSNAIYTKHLRVYINVIKLTKNEKLIFGGDKTGNIYIWSSITGLLTSSFQAHFGCIKDIIIDQILNVVYTYSDDNIIHVYNLHDMLRKKSAAKPMLFYQHDINTSIKQILPITPNIYDSYFTLISLTNDGSLYIWGLKTNQPIQILKTYSMNCSYICSNYPFNTHLYLCKANKIFRIPIASLLENEHEPNNECRKCKKTNLETINKCNSDYVKIIKNDEQDNKPYRNENFKDNKLLKNYSQNHPYFNLKFFTTFIGHKNDIIKCYVNDKNQFMISLGKDGLKIWDMYNCYPIKTLKYGENIIDFYVPSNKQFSYLVELPNLVLEYEDDAKINIIDEISETIIPEEYNQIFKNDESLLINMATIFAQHGIY
ncbi:WD repeat-containing protein, putative [Plasmodium berghei]|uniref:WD repeat-containing protein, putative n=2 Tax=Plasmodium berghei TaxID=5821 RepID=A0A509ASI5_PLABA|nr:WD repeat-containing protein, putative [Plasmodium berghei ANKA]CXJ24157.1 WD repeat-containing protein, putative [Plasmodium berghei]SCM26777.1 WD repeat-containing protein, putative [Plasmodium berghei]SCN28632.1 WD repeat-containing protein, putative [Plasmodium berghei]SCO62835.1 WD repeat-containing protein, putative [Plasmodium berghei]SCO64380.1 WD repeat-containing protein, putative [Plasmodium berghei]|eukprot:XP_034424276.1 WD repeat-containing protein, putative [Plasmodium berghei ANKA]